jgi:CO/xanthine dehydrogenase FAD-binding subunit
MVLFNAGKLPFRKFVSLRELPELRGIAAGDGDVRIGAAVTYSEIRRDAVLQSEFALLATAAGWTGGIANQNRGTLGGNIANASPAADSAPVLLAYDAELVLRSAQGTRSMAYRDFHSGYKIVQLRPGEIIAEIRLPRRRTRRHEYSRKVGARKAQAISKVSMAATAEVKDGAIHDVRIALASVAPVPLRCFETERFLTGRHITPLLVREAQEVIRREVQPISDIRSTSEYRLQVSANLLGEFLSGMG